MGAIGEMQVGEILRKLGPHWFVRHSVPIGAGTTDVDHLLIGPPGVFALNTKHHRNKSVWVGDHVLRVSNVNQPHLRNSRHEAAEVKRRLEKTSGIAVTVTSVIVIVGASSLVDRREPESRLISVVPESQLVSWLSSLAPALGEGELGLMQLAAEEPSTWHIDPHAADTLRVMQRFERLRNAVGASLLETPPQRSAAPTPTYVAAASNPRRSRPATPGTGAARTRKEKRRTANLAKAISGLMLIGAALIFGEPLGKFVTWFFTTYFVPSP
jgi:hypothetical protein